MQSAHALLQQEEQEKYAVREYFGHKGEGFFVEVGANEPTSPESQTWHLEQRGWTGVLIEPIPELADKARESRKQSIVFQAACVDSDAERTTTLLIPMASGGLVTGHASLRANIDEHNYSEFTRVEVQAATLTEILDQVGAEAVDLLSIDVEGAELDVLRGLDLSRYRPSLILLEDKHLYLSKHRFLRRRGYKLVRRLNRNSWYIPQDAQSPVEPWGKRIRLLKRMYLSIWFKKIKHAIRHRTMDPFRTL